MLAPPGGRMPRSRSKPPDRDIVAAVLAGIADPHDAPVGQPDPPRALDLDEEQFDRVGGPGELEALAGERPVLDLGAGEIKHAGAGLVDPPAPAGAVGLGAADEVGRNAVDRHVAGQLASASLRSPARNSRWRRPCRRRPGPSRNCSRRSRGAYRRLSDAAWAHSAVQSPARVSPETVLPPHQRRAACAEGARARAPPRHGERTRSLEQ